MRLSFRIKQHFLNAFREIFVHHHGSLEFRSKVFALVLAANEETNEKDYEIIKELSMKIYHDDGDRADLLVMTTKELVSKVKEDNGLDIDTLISHIQKELRIIPRYAKKIDTDILEPLLKVSTDKDTISYQENIVEFLKTIKNETLQKKKNQIEESEINLDCKYTK